MQTTRKQESFIKCDEEGLKMEHLSACHLCQPGSIFMLVWNLLESCNLEEIQYLLKQILEKNLWDNGSVWSPGALQFIYAKCLVLYPSSSILCAAGIGLKMGEPSARGLSLTCSILNTYVYFQEILLKNTSWWLFSYCYFLCPLVLTVISLD